MFGCLLMCPTPPHIYMLLCISVCSRGYCMHYGKTSHMLGGLEASAHWSGFWCLSVHPFCTFLIVIYVSSLYFHCYNYSSSSDCGVFWHVISIISDHDSLCNGASYSIGSAWFGSATTLTPRCSGGVPGNATVPQQQPPSLMPLQACVNYAMGSP